MKDTIFFITYSESTIIRDKTGNTNRLTRLFAVVFSHLYSSCKIYNNSFQRRFTKKEAL